MTMETGQQVAPETNSGAPPADPDAAKYEALRQQLGVGEPEQEPEAEPAPEPAAKEPDTEPEKVPAKPEHVPYAEHENVQKALREARAAQKATDDRLAQFMRIVEEARVPRGLPKEADKAPEQPKLPEVQEDPIAHYNARLDRIEQALQHTFHGTQQQTEQIRQHLQEQAMWGAVQASETEIRTPGSPAHKADYDDACKHLEGARIRQLDRMYPDSSPQVQAIARQHGLSTAEYKLQLLNQDRRSVATHALQQGMSPAQLYYELALDSGYAPKANGKAPPADKGKQQVEALKRGKAASLSISGGGGGKGAENMSVADLTDMFDEDPDAAMKILRKMGEKGLL